MLSLLGSIEDDPFSPEHVPETGISQTSVDEVEDEKDEASVMKIAWEDEERHEDEESADGDHYPNRALERSREAVAQEPKRRTGELQATGVTKKKAKSKKESRTSERKEKGGNEVKAKSKRTKL